MLSVLASDKQGEHVVVTLPKATVEVLWEDPWCSEQSPVRQREAITPDSALQQSCVVPSRKPLITLIVEVTTIAECSRKKKDSSSFLARTQPLKSHGLCFLRPSQLCFPLYKVLLLCFVSSCSSDTCVWLTMLADIKLQFSVDPRQTLFCWGNIRLTISDQQKTSTTRKVKLFFK